MNRRFSAVALAALVLGIFAQAAAAQTGATITLRHLQTEAFPIIAGTFAARDASGAPITGLQADAVQALEDGAAQPLTQLREVETGVRIIVVLNPAEPFAIRDAQARTRFEYVKEAVLGWVGRLPSNSNMPLTLITPDGVAVQDDNPDGWAAALETMPTVFGGFEVSNEALLRALELAAEPPAEPGMATAIWWITATPRAEVLAGIPDWQAALVERGIPLFVWQIDSPSTFESEAAVTLQSFATATGGASFAFSSGEVFPQPEDYFTPLRQAYYFQYDSQLHTAGNHDIAVALQSEAGSAQSQPVSFELDILPPNPILVSPPTQIDRGPSTENPQQLSPFSQPIEIIVEFPDEFQRDLIRTTLYVNDERVAENRAAPFTRFAWDLSEFTVSEQVLLRVEAQDELGLVGSSIEFPVQVRVEIRSPGIRSFWLAAVPRSP